ncbi:hypothetical protein N9L76_09025 [bacterium]|nr:hypothetical protein [bacterium]
MAVATTVWAVRIATRGPTTVPTRPTFEAILHIVVVACANLGHRLTSLRATFETTESTGRSSSASVRSCVVMWRDGLGANDGSVSENFLNQRAARSTSLIPFDGLITQAMGEQSGKYVPKTIEHLIL